METFLDSNSTTPIWVAFVVAETNGPPSLLANANNNPCGSGAAPAMAADNLHSGVLVVNRSRFIIHQSDRNFTVPASTIWTEPESVTGQESGLLDLTKVFTLCYATNGGSATDRTWRDSYIRVMFRDDDPPSMVAYSPVQGQTDVDVNTNIVLRFSESVQAGSGFLHIVPVVRSNHTIAPIVETAVVRGSQADPRAFPALTRRQYPPVPDQAVVFSVAANDTSQVTLSCRDLREDCPSLANRGMCHPKPGHTPSHDFATKVCQKSCGMCSTANTGKRASDTVVVNLHGRLSTSVTTYSVIVEPTAFLDNALQPHRFSGFNGTYNFTTRNCTSLCCKSSEYVSQNCTCVACNTKEAELDPNCQFWNDWRTYQRCVAWLPCDAPQTEGCGPNYLNGWKPYPAYHPDDTRRYYQTEPPNVRISENGGPFSYPTMP